MFFDVSAAFCPVALAQGILVKCSALWVAAVAFASTLVAINAARGTVAHLVIFGLEMASGVCEAWAKMNTEYMNIYIYIWACPKLLDRPASRAGLPQAPHTS